MADRHERLRALAARLGISVNDYSLFDRALTHASVSAEEGGPEEDYEALEFIGDAALGLAVAHYLYERAPNRTPGEYSRMRASVVNRGTLARVAQELEIAPVIRLGKGEESAGGRQRKSLLADCMEAIIGALYLDQGWPATKAFVERVLIKELTVAEREEDIWDYKSRLQHYCQANRLPLPRFDVIRSEGPDHRKEFEVEVSLSGEPVGRGRGLTKKEAEQNAARVALKHEGLLG